MKLIRKLPPRLNKTNHLQSWGIFWCDFCKQEVEKLLGNGLSAKSCGCNQNPIKHGECFTRLYRTWHHMKGRCLNPKNKDYKDYGGRDITICTEWIESYIIFRDWALSNGYVDNLEIDRIKNNEGYSPKNCRWVTHKENCNNKRKEYNLK